MRRFLITSSKFTGTAEIVYNLQGVLIIINTTQTSLAAVSLMHFKHTVPAHVDQVTTAFSSETMIVEAAFEITFEMFWIAYNHKINKKRCEGLWAKLSTSKKVAAWQGVTGYDAFLKETGWRKKADPETYLRNEYWENEWK